MPTRQSTSDVRHQFAELYVAAQFADSGWSIYFPQHDVGFDFIATKPVDSKILIRPVQVKGKFPEPNSKPATAYGYKGDLSAMHDEMVLAIAFFDALDKSARAPAPAHIAYMPRDKIQRRPDEQYYCRPGVFRDNVCSQRKVFAKYFNVSGLKLVESAVWGVGAS